MTVAAAPDPENAFASGTMLTGAVVSYLGNNLVISGAGIVGALADLYRQHSGLPRERDEWLMPGVPLLARGPAALVPLSWQPGATSRDGNLGERTDRLWREIRSACEYQRRGWPIGVLRAEVDAPEPTYASQMVRTGARRADWWEFGASAFVLVVYGAPVPAPAQAMALHIVPVQWLDADRDPRPPVPDLTWSWADVIEFARKTPPAPSGETPS